MREKLATLPLTQLKELAKSQGIKNISGLRKAELIDRLCETAEGADSKKAAAGNSENRESTAVPAQGTAVEAAASGNGFGSARTESAAPERASAASERADRQEHTGRQERTERYEQLSGQTEQPVRRPGCTDTGHFLSGPPEPEQCPGRPGHPGEHKNLPGRLPDKKPGNSELHCGPEERPPGP